jgi:anti-sigma regulatory factor (Ser/Thr protein kinase)
MPAYVTSGSIAADMNRNELRIANRPEEIERVRVWAGEFGHKYNLPRSVLDGLQISLDEVLANIIAYGYSDRAEHEILLRLAMVEETLIAEIEDDALPFDPTAAPAPNLSGDLEGREVGGLGIYFVRSLNDRIIYERVRGKNRLRLEKVLAQAGENNGGERS